MLSGQERGVGDDNKGDEGRGRNAVENTQRCFRQEQEHKDVTARRKLLFWSGATAAIRLFVSLACVATYGRNPELFLPLSQCFYQMRRSRHLVWNTHSLFFVFFSDN
jgi:hypothetical protein